MPKTIQAGVAQLTITPPLGISLQGSLHDRKANDVHDDLFAKALVLDDGKNPLAIVVLDVIAIRGDDVNQIRRFVAEHTHIPAENVFIACTHTHTGPVMFDMAGLFRDDDYCHWLVKKTADAVRMAVRRLQPARIAVDVGYEDSITFCRRFLMADGTVRCNPGRGNPDIVKVAGEIDPDVGVVYVETEDGTPMAAFVNYCLHYVGTDDQLEISADYFGHFQRVMQRIKGPQFVTLLSNGAQGHANNINVYDPHQQRGHAQARKVAEILAGEVTRVIGRMRPTADCPLGMVSDRVTFKRKEITKQDLQIAREIIEQNKHQEGPGPFSYVVGQPIPSSLRSVYAQEAIEVAKLPEEMETEFQVLRIGDAAIVSFPGEFFAEIGLAVKKASAASKTFIVGLANGFIGYVPTDHALLNEGAYETWTCRWSLPDVGSETLFTNTSVRLIDQLFSSETSD